MVRSITAATASSSAVSARSGALRRSAPSPAAPWTSSRTCEDDWAYASRSCCPSVPPAPPPPPPTAMGRLRGGIMPAPPMPPPPLGAMEVAMPRPPSVGLSVGPAALTLTPAFTPPTPTRPGGSPAGPAPAAGMPGCRWEEDTLRCGRRRSGPDSPCAASSCACDAPPPCAPPTAMPGGPSEAAPAHCPAPCADCSAAIRSMRSCCSSSCCCCGFSRAVLSRPYCAASCCCCCCCCHRARACASAACCCATAASAACSCCSATAGCMPDACSCISCCCSMESLARDVISRFCMPACPCMM